VLFAILIAWLLLGEVASPIQALGGALILAGVVAVRVGELREVQEHPELLSEDLLVEPEPEAVHAP
jgi:drug/metabolite transporter (DMT)-like permease